MSKQSNLFFELGTEELPPNSLLTLRDALQDQIAVRLTKLGLKHSRIERYATPRRLALLIHDVDRKQSDKSIEKRGPALSAAFDNDGSPTKAAEGFARSCGIPVGQLNTLETEKGQWLCYEEKVTGATTVSLLADMIKQSLAALPIAKRMRWSDLSSEFVRPVHWVVLLFGDDVVETEVLGIRSDRYSRGHRFHHPDKIRIVDPSSYNDLLRQEGKVIVKFEERKQRIHDLATEAARAVNAEAHIEEPLLNEITALVEWPAAITGRFEDRFLELPEEVLITTMQSNQKYFPVKNTSGKLLPYFIAFSNIESKNIETVRQGNERVIRPRLADAEFFWQSDRKSNLESRVKQLSGIIFQKDLGTIADKSDRVEKLTEAIAKSLKIRSTMAKQAARLAKCDLLTDMVGEFPTLQGTMGRYYALADQEPNEVAEALEEQYLPKQSGGLLPQSQTGQILALADKIDTVVGIFSVGLVPSGDRDPYALRRAALGVLRIIVEKKLTLDLQYLVEMSARLFHHEFDRPSLIPTVMEFFIDRMKGYCLERGYKHDEFEAVLSVRPTAPLDFEMRLQAVQKFRGLKEAESLAAANKRIRNILRKSETAPAEDVNDQDLLEPQEIALLETSRNAEIAVTPMLEGRHYIDALTRLAQLRDSVDGFFDHVMVMSDDIQLRQNRLGLLTFIEKLFLRIADISKLQ